MFPFTPHTTPRLDFGLGGFLFGNLNNTSKEHFKLSLVRYPVDQDTVDQNT